MGEDARFRPMRQGQRGPRDEAETTENAREIREDVRIGRNPVLSLLKSEQPVECVYIQRGELKGTISAIVALAKKREIPIKEVAPIKLDMLSGGAAHQGVAAVIASQAYASMQDIFDKAGDEPPFLLICDEIEDPHNFGAIIRTAEAAGVHGVLIPKRRNVGLTAVVSKTAAGALESMPIVRVTNLASTIDELKAQGFWIFCADMAGDTWCQADYNGKIALVVGSEGSGVSRLIKDKCDFTVSLPMYGKITSLNASVAAGIVLYEAARQRHSVTKK